jgi:hypothetical protein
MRDESSDGDRCGGGIASGSPRICEDVTLALFERRYCRRWSGFGQALKKPQAALPTVSETWWHGGQHLYEPIDRALLDPALHDVVNPRLRGPHALGGLGLGQAVLLDVAPNLDHELRPQLEVLCVLEAEIREDIAIRWSDMSDAFHCRLFCSLIANNLDFASSISSFGVRWVFSQRQLRRRSVWRATGHAALSLSWWASCFRRDLTLGSTLGAAQFYSDREVHRALVGVTLAADASYS